MIIKIHSRGAGSGSGPVDYLLGKDRQRNDARVLRGDAERTRELIDGCDFARAYTSGVLSFQEADIAEPEKARLMEEWEQTLMTGLDKDQYACLWVEHQDKGRLELNFVIPNIELQSGKRLQPYFDRADRPRVNAWQTLTNDRLGLRDPNDPAYRRPLTQASDLPRDKQQAAEKLTIGLMNLMAQGAIRSRQDVVEQLESIGFTVARETKSSISIADPSGGRNIRLKGMIYERDFKFSAGLRGEIETASAGYRAEREARVREAGNVYQRGTAIKLAEHQQRYPRTERQVEGHDQSHGHHRAGLDSDLRRAPDWHSERDNLVSGADHQFTPERHRRLQPAAGEPESKKRRGGEDLQRRQPEEWLPGGAAGEGARRGKLHLNGGQHGGEVYREVTPPERTETALNDFEPEDTENHDRNGKTAAERLRAVTESLRAAFSGVGERLRQYAEDVFGHARREREDQSASYTLERAGAEFERAAEPVNQVIQDELMHRKELELQKQKQVTRHHNSPRMG